MAAAQAFRRMMRAWLLAAAMSGIAAAADPEPSLGSDPQYVLDPTEEIVIGYLCDKTDPCCAPHLAMAYLAVQHVNERNGAFIAELAGLPDNNTMPRLELEEVLLNASSDVYQTIAEHYRSVEVSRQPVALLSLLSTQDCEMLAPFVQQYSIPAFSVASAGSLGTLVSEQAEYSSFYRMVAPKKEVVDVQIALMRKYGWTKAAVLYDANVKEEFVLMHQLQEAGISENISFVGVHIEDDQAATIDRLLAQAQAKGIRTYVLLFESQNKLDAVVRRAYNTGKAGDKITAQGYVWIAANGNIPWDDPNAYPEHYYGSLALVQRTYNEEKMTEMARLWRSVMPQGCGVSPRGAVLSTIHRNHMPYEQCIGLANTYDAVATVALAKARLLTGGEVGEPPDSCPNAEFGGKSEALNSVLHAETSFDGLSGLVSRRGYPWEEKTGTWEIYNLNARLPGSSYAAHSWSRAAGLEAAARRRLVESRLLAEGRSLGGPTPDQMIWPGGQLTKPEGIFHSPCENVDCGHHGTCQMRSAIGRPMGWCRCEEGFIGLTCKVLYDPFRLTDHPNVADPNRAPTSVVTVPFVERLVNIDADEGTDGVVKVVLAESFIWEDPRVLQVLEPGNYTLDEARSLQAEGLLWLPSLKHERLIRLVDMGGKLEIRASGQLVVLMHRELKLEANLDWRAFPFDEQTLQLRFGASDSLTTSITVGSCDEYAALLTEEVRAACSEMSSDSPGVPTSTAEQRWSELWSLKSSALQVHRAGGGGDRIEIEIKVERSTETIMLRILVPSFFLVIVSWAGFFVNPKTLMPRFASSFISFLALQSFKTNAQKLTPSSASVITWIDVYMSAVGILMVFAVIENMYVPFVNDHSAERSAQLLDRVSRWAFPSAFILVLIAMGAAKEEVEVLQYIVHYWLGLFALGYILLAVWEHFTFRTSILKREVKRIRFVAEESAAHHHDIKIKLTVKPTELKSIFSTLDRCNSGIVEGPEVWPWLAKHITISPDHEKTLEDELKQALGPAYDNGFTLGEFEPLLTKMLCIMVLGSRQAGLIMEPADSSMTRVETQEENDDGDMVGPVCSNGVPVAV